MYLSTFYSQNANCLLVYSPDKTTVIKNIIPTLNTHICTYPITDISFIYKCHYIPENKTFWYPFQNNVSRLDIAKIVQDDLLVM